MRWPGWLQLRDECATSKNRSRRPTARPSDRPTQNVEPQSNCLISDFNLIICLCRRHTCCCWWHSFARLLIRLFNAPIPFRPPSCNSRNFLFLLAIVCSAPLRCNKVQVESAIIAQGGLVQPSCVILYSTQSTRGLHVISTTVWHIWARTDVRLGLFTRPLPLFHSRAYCTEKTK